MNSKKVINNSMNFNGSLSNTQIQQGTINSNQALEIKDDFDYDKIFVLLTQIQKYSDHELFSNEFGRNSEELRSIINEACEDALNKRNSGKLKDNISRIKSFASNITSGIIANGIYQIIIKSLSGI